MTTLPRSLRSPLPALAALRALACALGVLLALSGCNSESSDEQRQAEVIGNFYRIHLHNHAPGLPSADELKQFEPLLSHALQALLTQAEAAEARYHAVAGPQAAPLVEGDLFTSLYEGATSFAVQSCDSDAQRSTCEVAFRYQKDGADESWKDKILLVREEQQWRIDDIEFIGNDQSSQREYLTDTLADAISQVQ
ncbi:DUF3828 domain-containing protein [Herbaspirillum camelliae]|uniref:DUF3828 domain-containing protein n=1 Tax=Herbaspirillum camelliae TaxID=1892903 RepID=UPI000949FB00|nr:DUF3828 domain-containing protein [Herbaspirillum camelliae]